MLASDIAFTRGSPNVMMEAIACNVPLVITGALPGQEEGNPGFAERHHLGVVCDDIENLKDTINHLLVNDTKELNKIRNSQKTFNISSVSKNIVDFILNIEGKDKELMLQSMTSSAIENK
jgi:processive 1,2-diacylglycerol beta-glucosyltransferase